MALGHGGILSIASTTFRPILVTPSARIEPITQTIKTDVTGLSHHQYIKASPEA